MAEDPWGGEGEDGQTREDYIEVPVEETKISNQDADEDLTEGTEIMLHHTHLMEATFKGYLFMFVKYQHLRIHSSGR